MKLFLTGDLMTGRGIDQVLPQPVPPGLHEPYIRDARAYLRLAEERNGPIPARGSAEYVWGDVLEALDRSAPDARIVNLETAVTTSEDWHRGKDIHYRMHPGNIRVLTTAGIDLCILGNNHVLDWGRGGLEETLAVLHDAGLNTAGAGLTRREAMAPAVVEPPAGRLLVFSWGCPSSGIPEDWAATDDRSGVNLLPGLDGIDAQQVIHHIHSHRQRDDRVVVSIHWGGNWGHAIPPPQRAFAHRLVDAGAADIVHGHSSHHPKGIELYHGRLILYGAGDFLNDYEGIGGKEAYRPELVVMYLPTLTGSGALASLDMIPMRLRRFRLEHASAEEVRWLAETLDRESRPLGARVACQGEGRLALHPA